MLPTAFVIVLCSLLVSQAHGVTSPMPYRPGYGLGSWIPPQVIAGMKKEAYARSAILLSEQMDSAAESLARELKMATDPVTSPLDDSQDIPPPLPEAEAAAMMRDLTASREDAWAARLGAYESLFDQLNGQIATLKLASKTGKAPLEAFSTFASGAESPVDWSASEATLIDRAGDAFSVGSNTIKTDHVERKTTQDQATGTSSGAPSSNANREWLGLNELNLHPGAMTSATRALDEAYAESAVEQTLVLSSFATHRGVRQFKRLKLDSVKLRNAWNAYHPEFAIANPDAETARFLADFVKEFASAGAKNGSESTHHGSTKGAAVISLVTEVFQGSTLVGFVHFLKTEKSSQKTSASTFQSIKENAGAASFVAESVGRVSMMRAGAKRAAALAKENSLSVRFDLVSVGYIPSVKSQQVAFTLDNVRRSDVQRQQSTGYAGTAGRSEQQDNTDGVISATVAAANEAAKSNPVLGVETFMDAFDDYAKAAHERPDEMGAPVGLNVRDFTRADVMALVSQLAFGTTDAHTSVFAE